MSLIQHNNFNQPNLNGLVDIASDNITTNTISTGEIIINGENIVEDILTNKQKLTKINYDDITDTTSIDSNLNIGNNIKHTPGINYIIENTSNVGSLTIRNKDINGIERNMTIDQFINISGINDLRLNKLFVGGNLKNFNAYDDAVIKTTKISYNSSTDMTTMNSNLSLTGNLYLDDVTISKDELKYLDGVTSNIQTQLDNESGDISVLQQKTTKISYDSSTDNTTVNSDLTINGEMNLNNVKHVSETTNYTIENTANAGSITFKTTDFQSVVRSMIIDQFINISGINDLKLNKLFVGGTQINFNTYNATVANTQKITYNAGTNMTNILSKVTLFDTVDVYGNTTHLNNVYFYDDVEINGAGALKLGSITHTKGANYIIENSALSSSFQIKNKDSNSVVRSMIVDQFINVSGINDLTLNNRLFVGGNQINFDAYIDAVTKTTKMSYDGVTDTTTFLSKTNFDDNAFFNAGATIGQDSNILKFISVFNPDAGMRYENLINNYYTNFSQRDSLGTDATVLRLHNTKIDSLIRHDFAGQTNFNNIANFNSGITMTSNLTQNSSAQITQEVANYTGVNTFKESNFFGTIVMPSTNSSRNKIFQSNIAGDVDGQPNNLKYTSMRYQTTSGTSNFPILAMIENTSQNQFAFYPSLNPGAFNSIVDNQSRTLLANGSNALDNGSLVFTCWSNTRVGLKIKATLNQGNSCELWAGNLTNILMNSNTGTTMGNVDRIGFKDGTNQTTAAINPAGMITQFAGFSAPSGWLLCHGQLISKTTYSALWIVIGDTYLNGRTADANNFYIPDLREMYIKGAGQNFTYTKKYTYSGGNPLGAFLDQEVLPHYHKYTDKGNGSVSRTPGQNECANNNQRTNESDFVPYHPDGTPMTNNENRPQTIVLNYIIKV